jgi:hypothetical protein
LGFVKGNIFEELLTLFAKKIEKFSQNFFEKFQTGAIPANQLCH